jgi:hypothetical protein
MSQSSASTRDKTTHPVDPAPTKLPYDEICHEWPEVRGDDDEAGPEIDPLGQLMSEEHVLDPLEVRLARNCCQHVWTTAYHKPTRLSSANEEAYDDPGAQK